MQRSLHFFGLPMSRFCVYSCSARCSEVFLKTTDVLWRQLSCQRLQSSEPQQVVCGTNQIRMQLHTRQTTRERATQSTIGFHPAEDFFHALTLALADGVARMARGALIQTRRLAPAHHGDVRSDLAATQMGHKILVVVTLVGAQCAGPHVIAALPLQYRFG